MGTAIVFPGQGSQKPGMGRELYEGVPAARAVFDAVANATGIDITALCFEADAETLRQTSNAQIALYTVSGAAWAALRSRFPNLQPTAFAGHSVGEYAALAAAGVVSLEAGAKLVAERGRLMAEAAAEKPGAMAAILGLDFEQVAAACAQAADKGVVVVANDNCPGQTVISGEADAVAAAGELCKAAGAKRVMPLNVSGAFHSPLVSSAAKKMAAVVANIDFQPEAAPVFANVTAEPVTDPVEWPRLLPQQIESPVRWRESVLAMRSAGVERFIECGAGDVLTGLLKRIDPEAIGRSVGEPTALDSLEEATQ